MSILPLQHNKSILALAVVITLGTQATHSASAAILTVDLIHCLRFKPKYYDTEGSTDAVVSGDIIRL